jgi:hypothetical protein
MFHPYKFLDDSWLMCHKYINVHTLELYNHEVDGIVYGI